MKIWKYSVHGNASAEGFKEIFFPCTLKEETYVEHVLTIAEASGESSRG
jgi:hypothetical protein